jgi:tubulin polyglutamylase TTLL6/13
VIKDVKSFNWSICWNDCYISEDTIRRMAPFQKINHFPGSYYLCRKNFLANYLQKLQLRFPEEYNFFPKTWILPTGYKSLLEYAMQNKKKPFIAKPEAACQGKGIFLTKHVEKTLENREGYIVQEYLKDPFLIDGLKFDLRLYILIKNIEEMKIFFYREGLARFATEKFSPPNKNNMNNFFMHLTNYSLNKKNPKFIFNSDAEKDDIGHKRSFSSILIVKTLFII